MTRVVPAIFVVFLILLIVPMGSYGFFTTLDWVHIPIEGEGLRGSMLGVLISKIATAVVFVLMLQLAARSWRERWRLYAGLWWLFFIFGEIGQALGGGDRWGDAAGEAWGNALAGMVAATIYCPLAAVVAHWMLGLRAGSPDDRSGPSAAW